MPPSAPPWRRPATSTQAERWLDRRDWRHITAKTLTSRPVLSPWGAGREAYFRIEAITHPVRVPGLEGEFTISDVGYSWYQLALRDSFVWLSAAFDAAGGLIELYFDITAGNDFSDPENPRFVDCYLDYTLSPEGRIRVLDRDELERAPLSREAYERTLAEGEKLEKLLRRDGEKLVNWVKEQANSLRALL
ncbi:MAG: DUF402 domain-containing protein [bacterium]